ncbi:MAG TPA: glycosyltransferase family 2 protein [Bacteroidetes bacterium]|nr:glycosyltransferase family 2 protein [Bacteroidota bacterium]
MDISVVIITKNEERNIRRCLASLQGLAKEVIVIDSFSDDGTQEICAEFGVRFIQQKWMGYSATKNKGNALANYPWILSLDADEALTADLRQHIQDLNNKPLAAYSFNRLAFYCGKPIRRCGWYPDRKVRLFPKNKARWEGDFVHEELVPDANLPIHHLEGDLMHFTYYNVEEHHAKSEKYSDLAAQALVENPSGKLRFKATFSPVMRFFKMYILRLGFLDGYYGYQVCRITAGEVRKKYQKALRLQKSQG